VESIRFGGCSLQSLGVTAIELEVAEVRVARPGPVRPPLALEALEVFADHLALPIVEDARRIRPAAADRARLDEFDDRTGAVE